MQVTMKIEGLKEAQQRLAGFSDRRLAAVGSTALTRTANEISHLWSQRMEERFDRPTAATVKSPRVNRAQAVKLNAEVYIRDQGAGTPPSKWLEPEEFGGSRRLKKFEQALQSQGSMPSGYYAVPGPGAKLDAYGNVSRGQIVQTIAQLGAKFSPGYQRVISQSAAKRAARAVKLGRTYIAINKKNGKLPMGVYERRGKSIVAVFFFVRSVSYKPRTGLLDLAAQQAPRLFERQLYRAFGESAARLAARGAA